MAWLGEELGEARGYAGTALRQGRDRGAAVRPATRPVHRSLCGVHGHDEPIVLRRGRRDAGRAWLSRDYRPDLKQMILGLVVDGSGSPLCTEMWPGNTSDTTLLPVIDRLRQRFGIGRGCVVADR